MFGRVDASGRVVGSGAAGQAAAAATRRHDVRRDLGGAISMSQAVSSCAEGAMAMHGSHGKRTCAWPRAGLRGVLVAAQPYSIQVLSMQGCAFL